MLRFTILNSLIPKLHSLEGYTPRVWYSDGYRNVEPKAETCASDADCSEFHQTCINGYCSKLGITFDEHGIFHDHSLADAITTSNPLAHLNPPPHQHFYDYMHRLAQGLPLGGVKINNIDPDIDAPGEIDAEDELESAND